MGFIVLIIISLFLAFIIAGFKSEQWERDDREVSNRRAIADAYITRMQSDETPK